MIQNKLFYVGAGLATPKGKTLDGLYWNQTLFSWKRNR